MRQFFVATLLIASLVLPDAAAAAQQAESTVRIAAILPLTGTFGTGLNPSKIPAALRMAVDEVNQRGGLLGKKLELVVFDSASSALQARLAAQAAVKIGPLAVIGERVGSLSLAIAPI